MRAFPAASGKRTLRTKGSRVAGGTDLATAHPVSDGAAVNVHAVEPRDSDIRALGEAAEFDAAGN
jgi:hypothetical protein